MKVLYVRNLTSDVTEDSLKEKFGEFGKVERVKKIKDYGFVHFEERDDAVKAMDGLNGQKLGSLEVDISLAKPPSENKKKEQRKREQERRMMRAYMYGDVDYFYASPMRGGMRPGGGPRRAYAGKSKKNCHNIELKNLKNFFCNSLKGNTHQILSSFLIQYSFVLQ